MIASATGERAAGLDPLADRGPLDVLEGDVVIPAVVADRVDPGDVLVVEPGRGPAFLVEALDDLGVDRLLGREDLQGDMAVELDVDGAEDRPHPAGADGLLELEDVHRSPGTGSGGTSGTLRRRPGDPSEPSEAEPLEAESRWEPTGPWGGPDPRPSPPLGGGDASRAPGRGTPGSGRNIGIEHQMGGLGGMGRRRPPW